MFDLFSLKLLEAFDVAKNRVWAEKRWHWHPEYILWGLLQAKESTAVKALVAIGVDVPALSKRVEKLLGPETKPEPKSKKHEKFGKEFFEILMKIKKNYAYGKQTDISTLDFLEGIQRFGPRRTTAILDEFGVNAKSLKRARKEIGGGFEPKGQTEEHKKAMRAFFEQMLRDKADPKKYGDLKKYGFESLDQLKEWLDRGSPMP
jgi:ATP-dependent Clp protease ATP-binding subunit ClpA